MPTALQIAMIAPRLLVLTTSQPIRWGDMDALGHVNNTVYFRYMEQARMEWLYGMHVHVKGGYVEGEGPVIVNARCEFLIPLVYPGDVAIRMYLSHPGRSSVDSHYEMQMGGTTYAKGAAKIVWIDLASGRPKPLPEAIIAPLRSLAVGRS